MAFAEYDTGVRTFSNPISSYADAERVYDATLQQTPRVVKVFAQRPDNTPAVEVASLSVHAETQNVALFGFQGELWATIFYLDLSDQTRRVRHIPCGVRLAAPATPQPSDPTALELARALVVKLGG